MTSLRSLTLRSLTLRRSARARAAVRGPVLALVVVTALSGCGALVGLGPVPTDTVGGAVDAARAKTVAARVIADAVKADAVPKAAGDASRAAVYSGDALVAARADAKLTSVTGATGRADRALSGTPPVVLAVSRGLTYPRSMVVQTTRAKSGLPVLSLLVTPDVRSPYRIAASATMLPGASVKSFAPLIQGSDPLGGGAGGGAGAGAGLAVAPLTLTKQYAAALAFPAPKPTGATSFVTGDSFASGVRASAANQNTSMHGIGSFTQEHTARGVLGGMRTADGTGALVFAALDRRDTFLNRAKGTLKPSASFTLLTGLSSVTAEADLSTLEIVVFFVPDTGQAVTVAAEEHLYDASGV